MNAKAAKDERRQIRRAVGEDALSMMRDLARQVDAQHHGLLMFQGAFEVAQRDAAKNTEPLRRPFWGRLKWLLRGL